MKVLGLHESHQVQEVSLTGCTIRVSHLAEYVSGLPALTAFYYDGYENGWMALECPLVRAPNMEQQLLAVALGGATQLTALFIGGLTQHGFMQMDTPEHSGSGSESDTEGVVSDSTAANQVVGWGEHLKDLRKLERLELLVDVQDSDLLPLTALTALTHLNLGDASNTSCDVWESVQQHLTRLKEVNPCTIYKNPWGILKP